MKNVVESNRERDLYLTDGRHVYFAPKGWCDEWSVAAGFTGGLDFVDDNGTAVPEIYCYAPVYLEPNSRVDTMFIEVRILENMREIGEDEAKKLHPALFEHLATINNEA